MTKWPLHPKPSEYQCLDSWIENLAKFYGVTYQTFCKNVLGLTSQEIAALTESLPEKAILILSRGTGIPCDDLRERSLTGSMRKLMLAISLEMEKTSEKKLKS